MPRRLAAAISAAVCFCAAVLAATLGWANALAGADSEYPATQPPLTVATVESRDWRLSYRRILRARSLVPWEASYSQKLGNLHAWKVLFLPAGAAAAEHRRWARAYYLEALAQRPTSGMAWVQFAEFNQLATAFEPGVEVGP